MGIRDFFVKQGEIAVLKREARQHYEAYYSIFEHYDCGLAMASHINPELPRHAAAFNAAMDKLAVIDPDTPKGRL